MKNNFTARPRVMVAAALGLAGLLGLGWWLWGPAAPVAATSVAASAGSAASPFGATSDAATDAMPEASVPVGAASQAMPVWGGPDPLANARPPAGADPVAFKNIQTLIAFTHYKKKFFKTFESEQPIPPATLQIMAQETEVHYKTGHLSLLDYYAANEVLLRAQYQGAALDAQLAALAKKIDGMNEQLKNQTTPEDEKFKVYKKKEAEIIQRAHKMKEFPGGVSKETYILKQIEAIR